MKILITKSHDKFSDNKKSILGHMVFFLSLFSVKVVGKKAKRRREVKEMKCKILSDILCLAAMKLRSSN